MQDIVQSQLWTYDGLGVHILTLPPDGRLGPTVMFFQDRSGRDAVVFGEPVSYDNSVTKFKLFRSSRGNPNDRWTKKVTYDKHVGDAEIHKTKEGYTIKFINFKPEVDLMVSPLPPPIDDTVVLNYTAA